MPKYSTRGSRDPGGFNPESWPAIKSHGRDRDGAQVLKGESASSPALKLVRMSLELHPKPSVTLLRSATPRAEKLFFAHL